MNADDQEEPIRMIVGLGNPGRRYKGTRHNVGFMVLDDLTTSLPDSWSTEKKWNTKICRDGNISYLKPQTFMNESGRAVAAVAKFFGIPPEGILVVYDDVDLPMGRLKFRAKGSAGGHNGIKSIIQHLGTDTFPRLKFGIGRDGPKGEMISHVLGPFSTSEQQILEKSLQDATQALEYALSGGLQDAMNQFNRKERTVAKSRKEKKTTPDEGPGTAPSSESEQDNE